MEAIRQALPEDAAQIARFIIQAMGSLAKKFAGTSNPSAINALFEHFAAQPANQYSYENTLVYEDENAIYGAITAYDGADLEVLRSPFLAYVKANGASVFSPETETQAGEYYIDCLGVSAEKQGQGIGKKLILGLIEKARTLGHHKVGLIVSKDNPQAEKLYARLGFDVVDKKQFMGEEYLHMQYDC
ncbi:GNAT family N-acetyltransferase [Pedobacter sp. MC2016-14]|uniref:GNAT family N-acetyltransferase n=1 Tax=Pedobacter sp. MC2016-14 TaxID=2897327 RepID=UPI001E5393A0|nr:GNAT family N-acetyltransferase [Pedobacter sp. MC2016-14]MCD0490056.1 GNAT family N-acetyltransferase [Pedobacter sp. MC2016-14]